LKQGTPLDEIRERWTRQDVMKANAILDMQDDFELGLDGLTKDDR